MVKKMHGGSGALDSLFNLLLAASKMPSHSFLLGLSNVKAVKYYILLANICECACLLMCDCLVGVY